MGWHGRLVGQPQQRLALVGGRPGLVSVGLERVGTRREHANGGRQMARWPCRRSSGGGRASTAESLRRAWRREPPRPWSRHARIR